MEGWHFILQARTEEESHQKTKIKAELYLIHGFHNISETDWLGAGLYSKSSLGRAVTPSKIDALMPWYQIVSRGGRWHSPVVQCIILLLVTVPTSVQLDHTLSTCYFTGKKQLVKCVQNVQTTLLLHCYCIYVLCFSFLYSRQVSQGFWVLFMSVITLCQMGLYNSVRGFRWAWEGLF